MTLQLADIKIEGDPLPAEGEFFDELCNDLNTPNAIAILLSELKTLNTILRSRPIDYEALLLSYRKVLDYLDTLGIKVDLPSLSEDDKSLYRQYNEAKAAKDFERSDEIRGELIKRGLF